MKSQEYSKLNHQKSPKNILRPSTSLNSNIFTSIKPSKLSQLNSFSKLQHKPPKPQITFQQKQITQQLQKQIILIENCIKNYEPFLKHLKQKQSKMTFKQKIFSLQDLIQSKKKQVQLIEQQIQQLKRTDKFTKNDKFQQSHSNQQSIRSSQQNQSSNPHFKLAQQLSIQRQILEQTQTQHQSKRQKLIEITSKVHQKEIQFQQRCKKTKEKFISYEDFKLLTAEKKKQIEKKLQKNNHRVQKIQCKTPTKLNKTPSKEKPFFSFSIEPRHHDIQPLDNNTKTLKDLQNKKLIAEQALKNSKKKHNFEMRQLMAKIQFLRDQEIELIENIKQKQEQKLMLQNKIQERGSSFNYSSHKLFIPQFGENRERRMRTGASSKQSRFKSPSNDSIRQTSLQKLKNKFSSPHLKLISAKLSSRQYAEDNEDYDAEYRTRGIKEKQSYFGLDSHKKYDDYEDKTFNPQSKNSFKQPSTHINDSILESY